MANLHSDGEEPKIKNVQTLMKCPGDWKAVILRAGICAKLPGYCILKFVCPVWAKVDAVYRRKGMLLK